MKRGRALLILETGPVFKVCQIGSWTEYDQHGDSYTGHHQELE
jgi:hypothetical protein